MIYLKKNVIFSNSRRYICAMIKNYTLITLLICPIFSSFGQLIHDTDVETQDIELTSPTELTREKDCKDLVFQTNELREYEFNLKCKTEAYPFISKDGKHLYFTNNQTKDWIFYSAYDSVEGKWSLPIPIEIDGYKGSIRSCYLTDNQSEMYLVGTYGLQRCYSVNGSKTHFSGLESIYVNNNGEDGAMPFSYLSFCDDMKTMYAYVGSSEDYLTMRKFVKTGDNSYDLKSEVGFAKVEMGMVSEDGKSYFYTDDEYPNILFCRLWDDNVNNFGQTVYIAKAFEAHLEITQLRFATDANLMVLVLSEDSWDKNDLFFLDYDFSKHPLDKLKVFDPKVDISVNPIFEYNTTQSDVVPVIEEIFNEIDSAVAAPVYNEKSIQSRTEINDMGASRYKLQIGQPFPNPAKNIFYIYYNVYSEDAKKDLKPTLTITDLSGKTVLTMKLDSKTGEAKVEFSNLAAGNYLVRIDYNGISSETVRISIQP